VIKAVVFDVFGTLLQIGERRHPFRQLMQQLRLQGRQPKPGDARILMTQNLGLAGAAALFGAQLNQFELARLETDLFTELASFRCFEDTLESLNQLKEAGLKLALCSNLAAPYAIPAKLLLPAFDVYAWSFEVGAIKPEPAIYRQVIEQFGFEASAIAMIGDTLVADVLGPETQGMQGHHLHREGKVRQAGFATLREFAEFILQ